MTKPVGGYGVRVRRRAVTRPAVRRPPAALRSLAVLTLVLACGLAGRPGPLVAQDSAGAVADEGSRVAGGPGSDLDDAELDALAAQLAAELRCPVCRNQSVSESSAELSREMHATIRAKLAAGESPAEVKAYFVSRYGEWILLKPTARGVNLAVYALPALVLLLGGAFVLARLRGWSRTGPAEPAPPLDGVSEEDRRWLEEALRRGEP